MKKYITNLWREISYPRAFLVVLVKKIKHIEKLNKLS